MATYSRVEIEAYRQFMVNAKGLTRMKFGDREYFFAPQADMQARLADMERHADDAPTPPSHTRYAVTSKGFGWRSGRGWGDR